MLSKSQKRVVVGATALVIIVLFVVPAMNVNRYRLSVAQGLSRALGRDVTVQAISIQTFPQPGLLLSGVVIADDPSISAEPMLRADEVLAILRVTSLWRGRLEISKLELKYPSLNLVRANDGRWNVESLLERAREAPAAPTAKTRPESRSRFPYIQSDGGRINLKIGNEKKVFALSEADFALWLASEDEWRMRLEARPIRTDANLSDTGTLKMEGSWRRAPRLHETPIYARLWWDYGQLGQITRLLYGRDRGWRGAVTGSAIVSGQPDKLQVKLDAQLRDFRRYDIATSDSMDVEAHCNGEYNFSSKQLRDIGCQMPAGSGVVLVNGHYGFQPSDDAELSISAESVPVQRLWQLARHAKRDLPSDTTATGVLTAIFTRRGQQHPVWTGDAQTSAIELRSTVLSKPLRIEATRWSLMSPGDESATKPKKKSGRKSEVPDLTLPAPPVPSRIALRWQPVSIGLDGTQAATLAGWFSAESYYSELQGEAELPRVFEVAKLAGLPEPASTIEGLAKGQVRVSGEWAGFGPATISGAAQLRNISARVSGVSKPLKISAGVFKSDKDSFEIRNAALRIDGVHTDFEVSASWPQHCATSDSAPCAIQFSVTADQLNTDEINTLLNPKAQKQPWYATLASSVMGSERKKFPEIFARGDIAANSLVVKSTTLSPFKCSAEVHPKGFRLSNIAAGLFGGKYSGEVIADLTQDDPRYSWTGTLDSVAMANVAAAMKDGWATGTLTSHLEGQAAGWNAEAILASLSGVAEFDWTNGSLPHVEIDGSGKPLQFKHFSGIVKLTDGLLTVSEGKLQSAKSIYHVSGTASLQKQLKLKLARDGVPELSISGPLEHPTVSSSKVAETQAQLRQSR